MGSWRTDVWIKKNDDNGNEITSAKYNYIGRGKSFQFTPTNNWKTVSGMGSKFIQMQAAGKYSVSGTLKTYLDYNNFYHLIGAFEEYEPVTTQVAGGKTVYKHSFKKSNLQRIPSFTMIARKLNRKVGGGCDETTKFEKVYFKGITLTWESGNPLVQVTYNWVAVYNATDYDDVGTLELPDADALRTEHQVEWGCLAYSCDGVTYTPIATNEKTKMSFSTTLGEIGQCGARFATDFNEQKTGTVSTESSLYSRDGHWLKRVYKGGDLTESQLNEAGKFAPKNKHIKPIPYLRICSFEDQDDISKSEYKLYVTMQNVMVESMLQDYGTSGSVADSPTLNATRVWLDVFTPDVDENIYTKVKIGGTSLSVTQPLDGDIQLDDPDMTVKGNTEVGATATITINGTESPLTVDSSGKFAYPFTLIEGTNTIKVKSKVGTKGQSEVSLAVKHYRHPALSVTTPTQGQAVASPFNVEGTTDVDLTVVEVMLNGGTPITASRDGQNFKVENLAPIAGENTIIVTAKRTVEGVTYDSTEEIKVTYTP